MSELANHSSLSVSYLNEIESGKKYPKSEKILALAEALSVSYDNIVSVKLNKSLAPIGELLDSNILKQLPIDHYGIDINKLIALLANAPMQLNAIVSTIIEIARSSEQSRNIFSKTALRIYKEFNDNYFYELEKRVERFREENKLTDIIKIGSKKLIELLTNNFNYSVNTKNLSNYDELFLLRGVVKRGAANKIFTNKLLSQSQLSFILGKEIAYNYLEITDRSYLYPSSNLDSFEQLLNNLNASYFSTALLIPKVNIEEDFDNFLKLKKWNNKFLLNLLKKYQVTSEMLFQRISNIAPKYFQINKFFFLRFNCDVNSDKYELSKELHLNTHQNPGGYHSNEHYCRRWISICVIEELKKKQKDNPNTEQHIIGIQKSKFINSNDEYLSISIAKSSRIKNDAFSSVTIGFLVDSDLEKKINYLNDPRIKTREVNDTCENCNLTNCMERVAEPITVQTQAKKENIKLAIEKLISESS
ncbi:MAG: helix-turn-helix domain-containing protein [Melioribacteraceae bacterium]|nr:helix-turn-helix domain-containing protein [Melioribacteraceae bacterium]